MTASPTLPTTSRATLVAALTFAAVIAFAGCSRDATPAPSAQATADTAAAPPAAQFEARLNLVNNNGTVRYDGTVDSESTRKAIEAMLRQAYGPGISGSLAVDSAARPAPWQANLPQFLSAFTMPGAAIGFDGQRIELGGYASDPDRTALLSRAEQLFPGYTLTGLFRGVGNSPDAAAQALAGLKTGASAGDVIKALNQTPIQFIDGSAQVSPDSLAVLSQAAKAIQGSGGEKRIEITGPAGAAEDLALSQQRAEAIKVQLIVNGVSPGSIETKGARCRQPGQRCELQVAVSASVAATTLGPRLRGDDGLLPKTGK
ncbi:OmpA family protein [Lysobacter arenosi]|uniref:OmpA family protein n=1 Tax=Lysobacter arenosi TaxID=2795387 RepID=A0ABX7RDL9_9GAMM|nr:OmpA family protein [Lysobacter arenosi]QSX76253.1 OmpA family protein [Lysobacter arenosi]